ncbi:tetratricopeptide repeat-containing sulfotransferase family protein [Ostreiculturibacter nitratireducens]|uniref:tetratricopeptide repeat-containing sulfotransferase family protein n=1 Tax=Ostreiculturibacter nitratireducens TaxID=3075226 RepID=UPI0031B5F7DC
MRAPAGRVADLRAALGRAAGLRSQGRPAEARQLLENLAKAAPKVPDIHLMLWQICSGQGDGTAALSHLRRAAELSGPNPKIWTTLIRELVRAGQKGRARSMAQKAPLSAADKKALAALADEAPQRPTGPGLGGAPEAEVRAVMDDISNKRLVAARAGLEKLLDEHAGSAFVLNLRGVLSMEEGNAAEAENWFRKALVKFGAYPEALQNLGASLLRQSKLDESESALIEAHRLAPESVDIVLALSDVLFRKGSAQSAEEWAARALVLDPDNIAALFQVALSRERAQKFQSALEALKEVERRLGRHFDGQAAMARCIAGVEGEEAAIAYLRSIESPSEDVSIELPQQLAYIGRMDEALEALEAHLERYPDHVDGYWLLTQLRKLPVDAPELGKLKSALDSESLTVQQRSSAGYALGKVLGDAGEHAASFAAIAEANRLLRSTVSYSVDEDLQKLQRTSENWTRDVIRKMSAAGDARLHPIFIIGLPRTGSSLTERILARHPQVRALGEDRTAAVVAGRAREPSLDAIRNIVGDGSGAIRAASQGGFSVTDKMLDNFRNVGALAAAFPRARFVHILRDPRSIALSIFQARLRPTGHPFALDLEELGKVYVGYYRLMQHWRETVPDMLVEVSYKDLVSNPEPEIRNLLEKLGLPWDEACLSPEKSEHATRTHSFAQVRQKIHSSSTERWRRYERELEPFTRILTDAGIPLED